MSEGHKFDSCRGIRFCFLSYARESMNITSFSCLWLIVTQRSDTIRLCHLKRFFAALLLLLSITPGADIPMSQSELETNVMKPIPSVGKRV